MPSSSSHREIGRVQPERDLEEDTDIERPWSLDGLRTGNPSRAGAAPVRVSVRCIVVDGPDGEALRAQQVHAIRTALAWLAERPAAGSCSQGLSSRTEAVSKRDSN
ncbi:hypothetical protein SCA03_35200 [Streptomyces cacaoi]|uniref:Uncharacterized protein n=1 Tax=Streptomyces cacaoi TaxID=1898 RepID=A0A4Y3R151_STRCI|nr:hypothetical protein SCA03_35200 [Streptomyces cacaoi]